MSPETKDTVLFLAQLVRDLGFPTIVAGYLLYRIHPALLDLTRAIRELPAHLTRDPR